MLKTTVSKTMSGNSVVKTVDGLESVVASMSASIQEDGTISINKYVSNKELYNANKDEVRADMEAFEAAVYKEEDTEK